MKSYPQIFPHVINSAIGVSTFCPQSYAQGDLWTGIRSNEHWTALEKAKRPRALTRRPLLIRSLDLTSGGTLQMSTNGLSAAAETHLNLLRQERTKLDRQDRYYVGLAFQYGLTVPQIAERSGLTVTAVQELLVGA